MNLPDINQINKEALITGLFELATGVILPTVGNPPKK
jgi:hypothetical protein